MFKVILKQPWAEMASAHSVGNSSYSNFVNKTTYFYMALHPGWNNVTMSVTDAETADVELSIVSAVHQRDGSFGVILVILQTELLIYNTY
jgi:hypothetical protein